MSSNVEDSSGVAIFLKKEKMSQKSGCVGGSQVVFYIQGVNTSCYFCFEKSTSDGTP
jgi:pyruvate formate-lyase activating enzyme-like uncharacterized protein